MYAYGTGSSSQKIQPTTAVFPSPCSTSSKSGCKRRPIRFACGGTRTYALHLADLIGHNHFLNAIARTWKNAVTVLLRTPRVHHNTSTYLHTRHYYTYMLLGSAGNCDVKSSIMVCASCMSSRSPLRSPR